MEPVQRMFPVGQIHRQAAKYRCSPYDPKRPQQAGQTEPQRRSM